MLIDISVTAWTLKDCVACSFFFVLKTSCIYIDFHLFDTIIGSNRGSCNSSLRIKICLQGRCIVFQNLQWQKLAVTERLPSDDDTVNLVALESVITTFFLKDNCLWTKRNAYGVRREAYSHSGDFSGALITLLFAIAMSVAWSLSFRRDDNTEKNWSKNVSRLTCLEHTLFIFAFKPVICAFTQGKIYTFVALHPLVPDGVPIGIVITD